MSGYLLTESADIINTESAERIVWDTFSGDAILAGAVAVTAVGRRVALAQGAFGGIAVAAAAAMRFASGAAAIAAAGAINAGAQRIALSGAIILAWSTIVALARRQWEPEVPAADVWDKPDEPESLWTEQPPG